MRIHFALNKNTLLKWLHSKVKTNNNTHTQCEKSPLEMLMGVSELCCIQDVSTRQGSFLP